MTDLWVEATHDFEREDSDRQLVAAREQVVDLWQFLASASDQDDYENRKALISDRLDQAAQGETRNRLEAALDRDFEVVLSQRPKVRKSAYDLFDFDDGVCRETIKKLQAVDGYDESAVLEAIKGIGYNNFQVLDEKPGYFGNYYDEDWHWKLRRARNSAEGFFEAITATGSKKTAYYSVEWSGGGGTDSGYASEAEAVRTAIEGGDPEAGIFYNTNDGDEYLGQAQKLSEELDLDFDDPGPSGHIDASKKTASSVTQIGANNQFDLYIEDYEDPDGIKAWSLGIARPGNPNPNWVARGLSDGAAVVAVTRLTEAAEAAGAGADNFVLPPLDDLSYSVYKATRKTAQKWRVEFIVADGSPEVWYTNAMRYDTEEEAAAAAQAKANAWMLVTDWRVVPEDTPMKQPLSETGPGKWGSRQVQGSGNGSWGSARPIPFGPKTASWEFDSPGFWIGDLSQFDAEVYENGEPGQHDYYAWAIYNKGSDKTLDEGVSASKIQAMQMVEELNRLTEQGVKQFGAKSHTALAPVPTTTINIDGRDITVYAAPSSTGQPRNRWIAIEVMNTENVGHEWFGGADRDTVSRKVGRGPWKVIDTTQYEWTSTPAWKILGSRKTAEWRAYTIVDESKLTDEARYSFIGFFESEEEAKAFAEAPRPNGRGVPPGVWGDRVYLTSVPGNPEVMVVDGREVPFTGAKTAVKIDAPFIKKWLLTHWTNDEGEVNCLLANKENWEYLEERGEMYRSQRWGEDSELGTDDMGVDESLGFALTGLIEGGHEPPAGGHLPGCPYGPGGRYHHSSLKTAGLRENLKSVGQRPVSKMSPGDWFETSHGDIAVLNRVEPYLSGTYKIGYDRWMGDGDYGSQPDSAQVRGDATFAVYEWIGDEGFMASKTAAFPAAFRIGDKVVVDVDAAPWEWEGEITRRGPNKPGAFRDTSSYFVKDEEGQEHGPIPSSRIVKIEAHKTAQAGPPEPWPESACGEQDEDTFCIRDADHDGDHQFRSRFWIEQKMDEAGLTSIEEELPEEGEEQAEEVPEEPAEKKPEEKPKGEVPPQFKKKTSRPKADLSKVAWGAGEIKVEFSEMFGTWAVYRENGETIDVVDTQEEAERVADEARKLGMRKGAPFADYSDFADCTSKNSDKDDPEAYCGYIKHKVEDSKESARIASALLPRLSSRDFEAATSELGKIQGAVCAHPEVLRDFDTGGWECLRCGYVYVPQDDDDQ